MRAYRTIRMAVHALRGNPAYVREKAGRELGYSPRPLEATLADTHAWFAEAGFIGRAAP